jgi:hypothetical protein
MVRAALIDSKPRHDSICPVPQSALARSVDFRDEMIWVTLTDGRVFGVPLTWLPTLAKATAEERAQYEIGGGGIGLHWPAMDENLSVAGLMAGADSRSIAAR